MCYRKKNAMDDAVQIKNISKVYKLYARPSDRLKETFSLSRTRYHQDFFALDDVSFDIKKGSTVGIIGQNGAGKSTLLKILTGVLTPSSGRCHVNGKVSSLLELGAGFNPDLTGLENVYFNGAMFGFTKREIDDKLDEILAFADIGEFIHQRVRAYSSGMFVRLAFAVAVQVDPDILIVDEALSVGDTRFQQKCFRRMKAFQESGKTVIFVTHDLGTVTSFCDHVYWMKNGRIHTQGPPADVVKKYLSYMSYGMDTQEGTEQETGLVPHGQGFGTALDGMKGTPGGKPERPDGDFSDIQWEDVSGCASFGEGGACIEKAAFVFEASGERIVQVQGGETVMFCMKIRIIDQLWDLGIGINVTDHLGNAVFAVPSYVYDYAFPEIPCGTELSCRIRFDFPHIKVGRYSLSAAVAEGNQMNHVQHHWVHDICFVDVVNTDPRYALGSVVVPKGEFEIDIRPGS